MSALPLLSHRSSSGAKDAGSLVPGDYVHQCHPFGLLEEVEEPPGGGSLKTQDGGSTCTSFIPTTPKHLLLQRGVPQSPVGLLQSLPSPCRGSSGGPKIISSSLGLSRENTEKFLQVPPPEDARSLQEEGAAPSGGGESPRGRPPPRKEGQEQQCGRRGLLLRDLPPGPLGDLRVGGARNPLGATLLSQEEKSKGPEAKGPEATSFDRRDEKEPPHKEGAVCIVQAPAPSRKESRSGSLTSVSSTTASGEGSGSEEGSDGGLLRTTKPLASAAPKRELAGLGGLGLGLALIPGISLSVDSSSFSGSGSGAETPPDDPKRLRGLASGPTSSSPEDSSSSLSQNTDREPKQAAGIWDHVPPPKGACSRSLVGRLSHQPQQLIPGQVTEILSWGAQAFAPKGSGGQHRLGCAEELEVDEEEEDDEDLVVIRRNGESSSSGSEADDEKSPVVLPDLNASSFSPPPGRLRPRTPGLGRAAVEKLRRSLPAPQQQHEGQQGTPPTSWTPGRQWYLRVLRHISEKCEVRYRGLKAGFLAADADGDGRLRRDELSAFLQRYQLPEATAGKVFDYLDKDKNGYVDRKEFLQGFHAAGGVSEPAPLRPRAAWDIRSMAHEQRFDSREPTWRYVASLGRDRLTSTRSVYTPRRPSFF